MHPLFWPSFCSSTWHRRCDAAGDTRHAGGAFCPSCRWGQCVGKSSWSGGGFLKNAAQHGGTPVPFMEPFLGIEKATNKEENGMRVNKIKGTCGNRKPQISLSISRSLIDWTSLNCSFYKLQSSPLNPIGVISAPRNSMFRVIDHVTFTFRIISVSIKDSQQSEHFAVRGSMNHLMSRGNMLKKSSNNNKSINIQPTCH